MNRREALFSLGAFAASVPLVAKTAQAREIKGFPPETALSEDSVPRPVRTGGALQVFKTDTERKTLAAMMDRIIPADAHGPSATEAGCLVFIDAQLAGEYGAGSTLFLGKPLNPQNEAQLMGAPQFIATPRERYASGLKALEAYARKTDGKSFAELSAERIDAILTGLEAGKIDLGEGGNGQAFFELVLQNTREGYLSDPLYGGNKGMVGWKMIGFPGARYDFRPYIDRRGEALNLTPLSLIPND